MPEQLDESPAQSASKAKLTSLLRERLPSSDEPAATSEPEPEPPSTSPQTEPISQPATAPEEAPPTETTSTEPTAAPTELGTMFSEFGFDTRHYADEKAALRAILGGYGQIHQRNQHLTDRLTALQKQSEEASAKQAKSEPPPAVKQWWEQYDPAWDGLIQQVQVQDAEGNVKTESQWLPGTTDAQKQAYLTWTAERNRQHDAWRRNPPEQAKAYVSMALADEKYVQEKLLPILRKVIDPQFQEHVAARDMHATMAEYYQRNGEWLIQKDLAGNFARDHNGNLIPSDWGRHLAQLVNEGLRWDRAVRLVELEAFYHLHGRVPAGGNGTAVLEANDKPAKAAKAPKRETFEDAGQRALEAADRFPAGLSADRRTKMTLRELLESKAMEMGGIG